MADEHFTDLEIRIFSLQDAGYPVELTLEGQQEFPRGYLMEGVLPWTSGGDLADDGQRLFDALFADGVLRDAWAESRGQAPERRIRLRIDPAAAELHALPWELLADNATMLSANAGTPFSRYLPVALPWGGEVEERPIRVLVVISNPADLASKYSLAPLDVDLEREILEGALEDLAPEAVAMDFLDPPVTLERIEEALREGYHVLHYLGHGVFSQRRRQAALYLENGEGQTQVVADDALIGMLARQQVRPRLIFLAACQSAARDTADAFRGLGPKLIAAGVPTVVAMQDFVAIETARNIIVQRMDQGAQAALVEKAISELRGKLN